MELGISGGIGLLFGVLLAWLALRSRTAALQARLSLTEKELAAAKADLARLLQDQRNLVESRARLESALESERKASNEKIELLTKAGDRAAADLQNAFKALAADALKNNNSSFLQIAQETLKRFQSEAKGDLDARQKAVADLVTPVRESLSKVDAQIQQMEVARGEAYGDLKAQVQSLITTQKELQSETGNLVRALRTPNVRGRWGEIQLRRVVEIAGMLSYCDFSPTPAHVRSAQRPHQVPGFRLQFFLRADERLNLGFQIAVGLAARDFHLLNLRVHFAQRLAHRADEIGDRFLAGVEIALGLALKALQRFLRDLQE